MTDRYDIRVENAADRGGPSSIWIAIEDQRYDCDGDSEGYYPNYAQATGNSKWDAIRELIDKLEENDS